MKPESILIDLQIYEIKIIDFGLSIAWEKDLVYSRVNNNIFLFTIYLLFVINFLFIIYFLFVINFLFAILILFEIFSFSQYLVWNSELLSSGILAPASEILRGLFCGPVGSGHHDVGTDVPGVSLLRTARSEQRKTQIGIGHQAVRNAGLAEVRPKMGHLVSEVS